MTARDIIKHVINDCMPFNSNTECYEYCDRYPICCCSMTKLAYDMIMKGEY